jgi:hypothetical protein
MYVVYGTSKMTVSKPLADSHLGSTIYHTRDDELFMPETCRGIIIQQTKNKQCIDLIVIHINHHARTTQYKTPETLYICVSNVTTATTLHSPRINQ